MRARSACAWLTVSAALMVAALPWSSSAANVLEQDGVLTVEGPDVNGLGGLTFQDSSLWVGNAPVGYPPECFLTSNGMGTPDLEVYRLDPIAGTILDVVHVPGTQYPMEPPAGLAGADGEAFITGFTHTESGILCFRSGSESYEVIDFPTPDPLLRAKGLYYDGSVLWEAQYLPQAGHIYGLDPATGQRLNDLTVDPYPYGITSDGKYFYVSHHDGPHGSGYIARYDRSGAKTATFELPEGLSSQPIGDLAYDGLNLYAHVLGTNQIVRLRLPAPVSAPGLPVGVLGVTTRADALIGPPGSPQCDSQTASGLEQLPLAVSLRQTRTGSITDLLGRARSYLGPDGTVHNAVHALAYAQGHDSNLVGKGELRVSKSLRVAPRSGLPAGWPVSARASATLNGLLQAFREGFLPSPEGLAARFTLEILKTAPGAPLKVFSGSIALVGADDGDDWVRVVLDGGLNTPAVRTALAEALLVEDTFARLDLEGLSVPFQVPANVGEVFDVDVIFRGEALVPLGADGLGAEVVLGEDPILWPGYSAQVLPPETPDGADPDGILYENFYVPEPTSVVLAALGLPLVLLRRRR